MTILLLERGGLVFTLGIVVWQNSLNSMCAYLHFAVESCRQCQCINLELVILSNVLLLAVLNLRPEAQGAASLAL